MATIEFWPFSPGTRFLVARDVVWLHTEAELRIDLQTQVLAIAADSDIAETMIQNAALWMYGSSVLIGAE